MRTLLLLIVSLFSSRAVNAQLTQLNIGDKLPDIYWGKFLDDPSNKLKVSDLKGKLVILDFWNIRCSVCLKGMPKMDSLQQKFKEQLQILTITYNNEQEVKGLFSKIKKQRPDLPFIISDTIFNSLFPHDGDPLHVWINQEGVVSAITFHYNTNEETVSKFLNGIDPKLSRRRDFGYDNQYPVASEQNSSLLELATDYSFLFQGLEEYSGSESIRIEDDMIRVINGQILRLYKIAYNNELYGFNVNNFNIRTNNRIIIETKGIDRFKPPIEETKVSEWIKQNVYSYELKVPLEKTCEKFKRMREDLDRYFPFKAKIENRKVKCLVLTSSKPGEPLKTKDTCTSVFETMTKGKTLIIRNKPVISLISSILYSNTTYPYPIIDGTNFKNNIDITIMSKLSDLKSLNEELKSFGLYLVEKEMQISMLVISDKR